MYVFENINNYQYSIKSIEDNYILPIKLPDVISCVRAANTYVDEWTTNIRNINELDRMLATKFAVLKGNTIIGELINGSEHWADYSFREAGKRYAPNGAESKLSEELYNIVRTPEFKRWFGDWENDPENSSKVVDCNGEPLVVYHGTRAIFTEFNKSASRGSGLKEQWFCFTTNRDMSKVYAEWDNDSQGYKEEGSIIMEAFLNIRDMPVIDGLRSNWRAAKMDFGYKIGSIHDIKDAFYNGNNAASITRKSGFCVENTIEMEEYGEEKHEHLMGTTYYVREPNQIKSIKSKGFNANSNNIYENNNK